MVKNRYIIIATIWCFVAFYIYANDDEVTSSSENKKEIITNTPIYSHNPKLDSSLGANTMSMEFYGYESDPIMVINAHGLIFLRGKVIGYDQELGEIISRNMQK